eukprot:scaffold51999_cov72-Phaeocystis_antarctica.AAC.2
MPCQAGTPRPAARAQGRAAARACPATGRVGRECCPAALVAARFCPRPTRRSAPAGQAAGCTVRPPSRGWRAAGSARGRGRRGAPRAQRYPAARAPPRSRQRGARAGRK